MAEKIPSTFLARAKVPFAEYYQHKISTGELSWKAPLAFRHCFDALFKKHVATVVEQFFPKRQKLTVLELGAGFLNKDRLSYLANSLHPHIDMDITFSDLDPKAVEDAQRKGLGRKYVQLNSTEIDKQFPGSSLDLVVASSLLDCLNGSQLSLTVFKVLDVLKEGGLFVHIMDLHPFYNTMVIDHKDDPFILFPLMDNREAPKKLLGIDETTPKGLQGLTREACVEFVTHAPGTAEAKFLQMYMDLSNDLRAAVIIEICQFPEWSLCLSRWVEKCFSQKQRQIFINEDFFQKRVDLAVKNTGFKVLQCGLSTQQEITLRTDEGASFNAFLSSRGHLTQLKIDLPEGQVRKASGVHILVLKKLAKDT